MDDEQAIIAGNIQGNACVLIQNLRIKENNKNRIFIQKLVINYSVLNHN